MNSTTGKSAWHEFISCAFEEETTFIQESVFKTMNHSNSYSNSFGAPAASSNNQRDNKLALSSYNSVQDVMMHRLTILRDVILPHKKVNFNVCDSAGNTPVMTLLIEMERDIER